MCIHAHKHTYMDTHIYSKLILYQKCKMTSNFIPVFKFFLKFAFSE